MIFEKKWPDVAPKPFLANGTPNGVVTVSDTTGFYVKQLVIISAIGFEDRQFQVKRVISSTQLIVGDPKKGIKYASDLSGYTLSTSPIIYATVQDRPAIAPADYERAVFAEEPIVAKRVIGVDQYGDYYTDDNPVPVKDTGISLAPPEFDEVIIQRDIEDDPIQYDFKLNSVNVGSIGVEYNTNKSPVRYYKI